MTSQICSLTFKILSKWHSQCQTFLVFFIGIASTSEAETGVSGSTQSELFIGDGKKYTVFGVTFSFNNAKISCPLQVFILWGLAGMHQCLH